MLPHDVSGPFFASALAYATEKLLQLWRASNFGEGPLAPADCDALLQPIQLATAVSIFENSAFLTYTARISDQFVSRGALYA
jgi:hypothetical protein